MRQLTGERAFRINLRLAVLLPFLAVSICCSIRAGQRGTESSHAQGSTAENQRHSQETDQLDPNLIAALREKYRVARLFAWGRLRIRRNDQLGRRKQSAQTGALCQE